MKTKVILTSIAALIMSVTVANAMDSRPFAGITLGVSDIKYSNKADDVARLKQTDLPTDFFAFGLEGGVRFGEYNKIYNGGVSLNFDMTDKQKARHTFTNQTLAKIKTFATSVTYDNYLRISGDKASRIDLVLGAGLGATNYNIDAKGTDDTVWSTTLVFKVGMDFEMTHNITLSAMGRAFVPTRPHYGINAQYVFGGAIRYMF